MSVLPRPTNHYWNNHPTDMTFAVDWVLKTNYLSKYRNGSISHEDYLWLCVDFAATFTEGAYWILFNSSVIKSHCQQLALISLQSVLSIGAWWSIVLLVVVVVVFIHFIIPFREIRTPYLGKATAAARAAQPSQGLEGHAGSFRVSVIHQTLTWTTGYLACIHDHVCVHIYIYTGVGHTDSESTQHFLPGKTFTSFLCAPDGVRTSAVWISSPTLYRLSLPVNCCCCHCWCCWCWCCCSCSCSCC